MSLTCFFQSTETEISLLLAIWDVISHEQRVSVIALLTALQGFVAEQDETEEAGLHFASVLAALGFRLRGHGNTEVHLANVAQFLEIFPSLSAYSIQCLLSRVDGRPPPDYVLQDDNGNPHEDMSAVTSSVSRSACVKDVALLPPS